MRVIYLSAHLDDAILSCGGLIYDQVQAGIDVEIWTFMCGMPAKESPESYLGRFEEDRMAAGILGATTVHLEFQDAFSRYFPDGTPLYESVFSPVNPSEVGFIERISEDIAMASPEDRLMCPLGVGGHVDHVILRWAAELLDRPLVYYTDFPYIEYVPEKLPAVIFGMEKHSETISPAGLSKWKEAVAEYASQTLYPTPEITAKKIIEYWSHTNGIFLWERQSVEQIFTKIYYENQWKDADTASGPGSTLEETAVIRSEIPRIARACGANSILDFPCGDFFWMRLVELDINYFGADIVRELVARNQTYYGNSTRKFMYANLLEAPLPVADIFLCRDCLGHFSQTDVQRALRNI